MPTFKLTVSPNALDLGQTVLRAIFAIKRASVVDSFVIVPDLKRDVVVADNEDFEVSLLPNTPGSVYEVVMFGTRTELMRAFFIMPAGDVFLHELNLLTAYPEINPVAASFLSLVDTPNSYVGHAGKLVAVKQDESGLEFVVNESEPPDENIDMGNTIIFARESSDFIPYELIALVYVNNELVFDRSNESLAYTPEVGFKNAGILQVGLSNSSDGSESTLLRNVSVDEKRVRITLAINPEYYGDDLEYIRMHQGIPLLRPNPLLNTNTSFTTTYNPLTQADYEINFKLKGAPAVIPTSALTGATFPVYRVGLKNVYYESNERFLVQVYAAGFIPNEEAEYLLLDGLTLLASAEGILPHEFDYGVRQNYQFSFSNDYAEGETETTLGTPEEPYYMSNRMMIDMPYYENGNFLIKITRLLKPWTGAVEFDPDYEYIQSQGDPASIAEYGPPRIASAVFEGNVMTIKINKSNV